ncbi:hypothetical protein FCM30_19315 [Lelliottia aquatilis]|uniref:hypothetical protein n=1 Tax=Lelliottia aquatilis TaxID=2080838 RepID=UPI001577131A|nr:hypothetical protein [Lelliottia aquatilis]NTZ47886.1 hypothetical protein [Lelliottia aquatilis]
MTNNKLTDEFLEKLIATGTYALDEGFIRISDDSELMAMARELQEYRKGGKIEIGSDMGVIAMSKRHYKSPVDAIWDIKAWAGQADVCPKKEVLDEIERYLEIAAGKASAVLLPDGKEPKSERADHEARAAEIGEAIGWNMCLMEVERLNEPK